MATKVKLLKALVWPVDTYGCKSFSIDTVDVLERSEALQATVNEGLAYGFLLGG